jgi:hypothetical protein
MSIKRSRWLVQQMEQNSNAQRQVPHSSVTSLRWRSYPKRWLIIGNCFDSLVLISWFRSERNPTVFESDLDCLIDVVEVFQAIDF